MLISKKAAIISSVLAFPFMASASYIWIQIYMTESITDKMFFQFYSLTIFLLGSPLTLIYMFLMAVIEKILKEAIENNLEFLVLPTLNLLFLIQWIIWSQLIVFIRRKFFKSTKLS
jgi:hypothetical protein